MGQGLLHFIRRTTGTEVNLAPCRSLAADVQAKRTAPARRIGTSL